MFQSESNKNDGKSDSARRSVTLGGNDTNSELEQLRREKRQWEREKAEYERKVKGLESEISQVRKEYESKLWDKIESQGNVIKDVKLLREEWEEKYQSRLSKYEQTIHNKDEMIARKDKLIQDLQERLASKSEQTDSLQDDLLKKQNECDGLQELLQDAIHSKMESLQRMELSNQSLVSLVFIVMNAKKVCLLFGVYCFLFCFFLGRY